MELLVFRILLDLTT